MSIRSNYHVWVGFTGGSRVVNEAVRHLPANMFNEDGQSLSNPEDIKAVVEKYGCWVERILDYEGYDFGLGVSVVLTGIIPIDSTCHSYSLSKIILASKALTRVFLDFGVDQQVRLCTLGYQRCTDECTVYPPISSLREYHSFSGDEHDY